MAAATAGLAGIAGCQELVPIGSDSERANTYDVPTREPTDRPTTQTTEAGSGIPGVNPGPQSDAVERTTRSVLRELSPSRRLVLFCRPGTASSTDGRYTVGFASPPTSGSPGTVYVQFTATADSTREYEFGPSPPFSNYRARPVDDPSEDRGFLLVPNDGRPFPYGDLIPETPRDGRWVATGGAGAPEGDPETGPVTMAPGESILGKYALLQPRDAGALPERWEYRFDTAPWSELELGFSLWDPDLASKPISRFTDAEPPFPAAEGTEWFHRSYPDRPRVYVEPLRERVEFGTAGASFDNYAAVPASVDRWALAKAQDGAWRPIGPPDPRGKLEGTVAPGTTRQVEFAVEDDVRTATVNNPRTMRTTFTGLRPGVYAVGFSVGGIPESPTRNVPLRIDPGGPAGTGRDGSPRGPPGLYAALIEIVGDLAELTPTVDANVVERADGVVTVELTPEGLEFDRDRKEKLVVVRGAPGDPPRLILEQVMQYPALRNALAYVEPGVKRVEVVTAPRLARQPVEFLELDPLQGFEYDGERFAAVVEEPSEATG
jgi:hypothetical protein